MQNWAATKFLVAIIAVVLCVGSVAALPIRGTLVVAVPVRDGLVVCSDKRLYNAETRTFTDTNVKIRKVNDNALFVATNTIGFYDQKARTMAFDAFELTSNYVKQNGFATEDRFWEGLKKDINDRLRFYLRERTFAEWPASDPANENLLFNLIFYSVREGRAWSHSVKVHYEKARTPIIRVSGPISEEVKTTKLSGKGREVMAFLSQNPAQIDASILKFDESRFDIAATFGTDGSTFAKKLIRLASTGVPQANVSAAADCAMLSYAGGFEWLNR